MKVSATATSAFVTKPETKTRCRNARQLARIASMMRPARMPTAL
jgi:hypothetical protein